MFGFFCSLHCLGFVHIKAYFSLLLLHSIPFYGYTTFVHSLPSNALVPTQIVLSPTLVFVSCLSEIHPHSFFIDLSLLFTLPFVFFVVLGLEPKSKHAR